MLCSFFFSVYLGNIFITAAIRATVDGGTNEWYKFSLTMENQLNNPIPDLISGDFDSVEPQSLSYFR
jgi:thiamine pyrophosphokinase